MPLIFFPLRSVTQIIPEFQGYFVEQIKGGLWLYLKPISGLRLTFLVVNRNPEVSFSLTLKQHHQQQQQQKYQQQDCYNCGNRVREL